MDNFIVDNIYNGFKLISKDYIEDYTSTGLYFRHEKTGFEVYALSCDDEECFFSYSVYTPPEDNTGVFHILEHTVLAGSEKYRVKDPFTEINKTSPNTYLNAMTGLDRTDYSASSPLKKDFDNIFLVYSDAVFRPLLRKESFLQEGIRLTKNGPEGVVFSEMKGNEMSHLSVVSETSLRSLYDDGTPLSFVSGGKSDEIITLTYEKYLETYKKYYVPNNMYLFLYGKLDIQEKLSFLDNEYLKNRERGERIPRFYVDKKWNKEKEVKKYSLSDGETNECTITLSWLLGPSEDEKESVLLSLLSDILLSSPGCPLYKSITSSSIGMDLSPCSGLSDEGRNLAFMVGITGTKEERKDLVKDCILSSLEKIVKEGIDDTLIRGILKRELFKEEEDSVQRGYKLYFDKIEKGWLYGVNPSHMLLGKRLIREILNEYEKDNTLFTSLIKKNLLDNPHMLISVVTSNVDEEEKREEKLKENLLSVKYERGDERLFNNWLKKEDKREEVELLPSLTFHDIPNKILNLNSKKDGKIIELVEKNEDILYSSILFDVSDFKSEEVQYLMILTKLLSMTNVGKMSYSDFMSKVKFYTGSFDIYLNITSDKSGEDKEYLIISFSSLSEDLSYAYSLLKNIVEEADTESEERIKAVINDMISTYNSLLIQNGHLVAFSHSSRGINRSMMMQENISGITFLNFLYKLSSIPLQDTARELSRLKKKVFVKERCTIHITGTKDGLEKERKQGESFISFLPCNNERIKVKEPFVFQEMPSTLFTFPSSVGFASLSCKHSTICTKEGEEETSFLNILSDDELWKELRDKNGAYGGGSGSMGIESVSYFFSYRDPCIDKARKIFTEAVKKQKIGDEEINKSKLYFLGEDIAPRTIKSKAKVSINRYIASLDEDFIRKRKDLSLSVDKKGLESARERILTYIEGGTLTLIGKSGKCDITKPLPLGSFNS